MAIVNQGMPTTIALEPGETLMVVADANSSGQVRRISQPGGALVGSQVQSVPASATIRNGTFPTVRHYSIECAAGFLTYTVSRDAFGFAAEKGNVEGFTGARTLRSEDNGKVLRCDDASNVIVTIPNDLPQGFNIGFAMWGAGTVTITAASGATNRSSKSALSTQYQVGALLVLKQPDGGAVAEFVLGGDFA